MYTLSRFGSITLPTSNTSYTSSPVPAQLSFVQTTSGVFDNDGDGRNRQVFPLLLSYKAAVTEDTIVANRTILDALRAAVGTRARLYRYADNDNSIHYCIARASGMPHDRPFIMRSHQEFELNFSQLTPWVGTIHGTGWVFDSGILFDAARTLDEVPPTTLNTNPKTIVVANNGNLPATDIQFTVTTGSTTITAFQIDGPSFSFRWAGSLLAGQSVTVDAGAAMVLKNGSDNYNAFTFGSGHALDRWAMLQPGNNNITVYLSGGGTNSTISIIYNDGWA